MALPDSYTHQNCLILETDRLGILMFGENWRNLKCKIASNSMHKFNFDIFHILNHSQDVDSHKLTMS